jgi:hypothetical protein
VSKADLEAGLGTSLVQLINPDDFVVQPLARELSAERTVSANTAPIDQPV